jgi:TPR repeat protein
VKRLDPAVAAGDADALFLHGHCFYHGENGCTQDYRKVVGDFLKSTDGGNADAAVSAAAMLPSGGFFGVLKDQEKAFELYMEQAIRGPVRVSVGG